MSTTVTLNGVSYSVPATGEARTWGPSLSAYLIAISTTVLQKTGGAFALTADANFGASKGLIALYIKSYTADLAGYVSTTGVIRLGNAESVGWRNAANSADKLLTVNASDKLAFDGGTGVTGTELGYVSGVTSALQTQMDLKAPLASPTFTGTVVLPSAQALTSPVLTTPNIVTQATIKAAGELRLNNAGDTFYTGFKSGNAAANKIWTLPLVDGSSGQLLGTDGSATLGWVSPLTNPMTTASDIIIGGASGTASRLGTNMLGRIQAEYTTATATMTIATPGVVTYTSHGRVTGDRCYFTTTGALPTGVSASTSYWITKVDANTFKLSTTLANCVAGTFIATSGSQSGVHTIYVGGLGNEEFRQGSLTGTAVPTGAVGEVIAATITQTTITSSILDITGATITLGQGRWEIVMSCNVSITTGATASNSTAAYLWVAGPSSDTLIAKSPRVTNIKTVAAVANSLDCGMHSSVIVDVTTAGSIYKVRGQRVDGTGTGTAVCLQNNASYYESHFYAKRIA
jgi:hypothetical protein